MPGKIWKDEPSSPRGQRLAGSIAALSAALFLSACNKPPANDAPTVIEPAADGVVTTLENEVRDVPGGKIAWSTFWKLCWDEYPGARGYEIQTLTGEGASPKLHRQAERCFRIQAAAGENDRSQGFLNRDLQLSLQKGQLAYRVRAILRDHRVSAWSPAMTVGKTTGTAR